MSGETGGDVSGWTVDTLHELLVTLNRTQDEARRTSIQDLKDLLTERHTAQQEAIRKADAAAEKRFDSVNEFRAQLADQAATFLSRVEYDAAHQALIDKLETQTSQNTRSIRELELRLTSRLDLMTGGQTGAQAFREEKRQSTGMVVGIVGAVLAVVTIAVTILIATRGH